jgi:hypothetical protein
MGDPSQRWARRTNNRPPIGGRLFVIISGVPKGARLETLEVVFCGSDQVEQYLLMRDS